MRDGEQTSREADEVFVDAMYELKAEPMKLRAGSRAWLVGVQLAVTVVYTLCAALGAVSIVKSTGDWMGGREMNLKLVIMSLIVLGVFGSMVVFLVPDFVRYPVGLCSVIEIDDQNIKGTSARGRLLIDAKWERINAGPDTGDVARLTVIVAAPRCGAVHLPLYLFTDQDRNHLKSKFGENRGAAWRRASRAIKA